MSKKKNYKNNKTTHEKNIIFLPKIKTQTMSNNVKKKKNLQKKRQTKMIKIKNCKQLLLKTHAKYKRLFFLIAKNKK